VSSRDPLPNESAYPWFSFGHNRTADLSQRHYRVDLLAIPLCRVNHCDSGQGAFVTHCGREPRRALWRWPVKVWIACRHEYLLTHRQNSSSIGICPLRVGDKLCLVSLSERLRFSLHSAKGPSAMSNVWRYWPTSRNVFGLRIPGSTLGGGDFGGESDVESERIGVLED
jgi:hypothetical protein